MTEEIIIENAFHLCQRLEQENKELKETIDDLLEKKPDCNDEFGCQELIELKQENKELKEMLSKEPKAMQAFQISYSGLKRDNETLWGMVKDYKTALEEIRTYLNTLSSIDNDFPNTETYLRIQDKINEVINESN